MKAITTRSGVAYEGPSIPTKPSPKKVVERETEETTDKEQTNFQGSTTYIQPLVISISKLGVSKTLPKPNIPYPSRLNDQKLQEKATNQMEKEEYAQEILGFSNNSLGGNPISNFEPIIFDYSLSPTPFEGSDFILEEIKAYLKDESISLEIDHADCDPEGDISLIEKLLNDDPFQLPLMDLKQGEVVKAKSLIEEPPELELKDLPSPWSMSLNTSLCGVSKADDICLLFLDSSKFLWCSSTSASLFLLRLLLDAEGTLSFFVLLLGCGLLVLVLSTPVEDKPFTSEFTSFLVMTVSETTGYGYQIHMKYPYIYPLDLPTELATVRS
nr:reverse transcriptase domain-containing protein [Tanacetum cinerariifolium]